MYPRIIAKITRNEDVLHTINSHSKISLQQITKTAYHHYGNKAIRLSYLDRTKIYIRENGPILLTSGNYLSYNGNWILISTHNPTANKQQLNKAL